jgi:hypothetical protein
MMQIAERYEAEGKTQAAERLYRQLAHMQPRNAEVRERLQALAEKSRSGPETPATAPGAVPPGADAQQLLAMLKRNKEAYEAQRYGDPQPTLAEEVPADLLADAPTLPVSQPTLSDEPATPSWAATESDEPAAPELAATEPVGDLPQIQPEGTTSGDSDLPTITPRGADSAVASSESDTSFPNDHEWAAEEPLTDDALVAEADEMANQPTEDDSWVGGVFEDGDGPELEEGTELAVDEPAVEGELEHELVATEDSGWVPTSAERLCPELQPELEALVAQLSSTDDNTRIAALNDLGGHGPQAASAELAIRVLLEDQNPIVRAHAASALREVKNDAWDSINTLRLLIFHPQDEVSQMACYMLGRIGTEAMDAASELTTLRDAQRGLTSLHAAEALIRIAPHDTASVDMLMSATREGDQQERWFATVALGSAGEPQRETVVETLTAALQDVSAEVRAAAALSLGGLGEYAQKARPALEQIAFNDTPEVQDAAATALACLEL